jgi:hypothetical protein
MTEPRRVAVYTGKPPSVTSRFNLKATMVPVGPMNRRTRRAGGRLTGGSGVDMKDKSHNSGAFSSQRSVVCLPLIPHLDSEIHVYSSLLDAIAPLCCAIIVCQGPFIFLLPLSQPDAPSTRVVRPLTVREQPATHAGAEAWRFVRSRWPCATSNWHPQRDARRASPRVELGQCRANGGWTALWLVDSDCPRCCAPRHPKAMLRVPTLGRAPGQRYQAARSPAPLRGLRGTACDSVRLSPAARAPRAP